MPFEVRRPARVKRHDPDERPFRPDERPQLHLRYVDPSMATAEPG